MSLSGFKVFFFLGLEEGAVLPGMQRHLRSIKGETDIQVSFFLICISRMK
jgi:hypothetical protein